MGQRLLSLPDSTIYEEVDEDSAPKYLNKRMVCLNRIMSNYWKRWHEEYLLELRNAHRYSGKTNNSDCLEVGDVVIVQDSSKPRGFWKVALIHELITGKDRQVRGATLKIGNGRFMRRSLQLLYPLEIKAKESSQEDFEQNLDICQEVEEIATIRRPRRDAAIRARLQNQAVAMYEQDSNEQD